jgi:ABC-2 type transport system ATP-binding protein
MDEAERCHRLAFIVRGDVLDEGRPDDVVARRALVAAEVDLADADDPAHEAAAALRGRPGVDEVEHYGHTLRIVVHAGTDPLALLASAVPGASPRLARVSVEDAFVAMVRSEEHAS